MRRTRRRRLPRKSRSQLPPVERHSTPRRPEPEIASHKSTAKSGRITRGSAYRQGPAPGRAPLTVLIQRARGPCYHLSLLYRYLPLSGRRNRASWRARSSSSSLSLSNNISVTRRRNREFSSSRRLIISTESIALDIWGRSCRSPCPTLSTESASPPVIFFQR